MAVVEDNVFVNQTLLVHFGYSQGTIVSSTVSYYPTAGATHVWTRYAAGFQEDKARPDSQILNLTVLADSASQHVNYHCLQGQIDSLSVSLVSLSHPEIKQHIWYTTDCGMVPAVEETRDLVVTTWYCPGLQKHYPGEGTLL